MTIKFEKGEAGLIKSYADSVFAERRRTGTKDRRISRKHSSEWINLNGLAAEFAVARALNLYPNISLKKDSGYDLVLGDLKIGVKATDYEKGSLIVDRPEADVYVLVVGRFPEMRVVGYCERENLEEIVSAGRKRTGKYQKDLKSIKELKNKKFIKEA